MKLLNERGTYSRAFAFVRDNHPGHFQRDGLRQVALDDAVFRLCLLVVLGVFAPAHSILAESVWSHESSDLPTDPAITWGVLPNGVRYAIRPNAEPKGRVSLRLVVLAGSMHEQDDERGLAHFLEHMAFRSTRDHPEGSLVANLQRMGIGFGPDNTAFTTHDYTIYHLELPDSKLATLQEGLGVFREYADGITFSAEEIDRERGVILSELATRDLPESRAWQAHQAALMPTARLHDRLPIGLEWQIRRFQPTDFQAFYDAWYRPERMTLTLVGDVTAETAEPLIAKLFGSLAGRGATRPEPPLLKRTAAVASQSHLFKDAGLVGASIVLARAVPDPTPRDSLARWQRDMHGGLAFHMLQRRLQNTAMERGASFSNPLLNYGDGPKGWIVHSLLLPGWTRTWDLTLRDGEQELRRALAFGFTAAELQAAKTYFRTYYEQAARSAATQPSDQIATGLATALAYDRVFCSAQQVANLILPWLETTTLDDCSAALHAAWGHEPPHLFIISHPASNATEEKISQAYAYSQRVEVQPAADPLAVQFAYTQFGPRGTLQNEQHIADLDLWLAQFANGVRYNFKHTDFERDTVLATLRIGYGKLSLPKNKPGLELLANYGFLSGGLGQHTNRQISTLLNGHVISLGFRTESDSFLFSLQCAPRELLLGLQLLTAILTDSAYGPEAVRAARAGYGALFESLTNSPGGPIYATVPHLLAGGDTRFGVPDERTLNLRSMAELRQWLIPQFRHAPIELSVVGDLPRDVATDAVARTLGALPPRNTIRQLTEDRTVVAPDAPTRPTIWPISPAQRQVALAYFFPVADQPGAHLERRCHLLAAVLEERLRQRVREELGVAYAVTARFTLNEGFPRQSFIEAYAEVETARADEADRIIRREIAALHQSGFTADEFARAKQPFIAQRSMDPRRNNYWAFTVLAGAQDSPLKLAAARDRAADTAAISQGEVQGLIDRWLVPTKAHAFRTVPRKEPHR